MEKSQGKNTIGVNKNKSLVCTTEDNILSGLEKIIKDAVIK